MTTADAGVSSDEYTPLGFKLNLMYARIPPRYYRNLHNFNEFNAPRIDMGMLTASIHEQAVYDFTPTYLPSVADRFYRERRDEISALVRDTLMHAHVISEPDELDFVDGIKFVPPTKAVKPSCYSPGKQYPLFVLYTHGDSEGDPENRGAPFLRVILARLITTAQAGGPYNWDYKEVRIGRGDERYQYKPFIAAPMFIAYFPDTYTSLDFDDMAPASLAVYAAHSVYVRVHEDVKEPYEDLVGRESISAPNEYGEFVVSWDDVPVRRSIVASQTYYDWDDDFQSAQVEALLHRRIVALEGSVSALRREIESLRNA